ncbi:MAG: cytochrome c [Roseicyclus sp.]|nr:cytochrome c [Roseicyclus sp.]
MTISRTFLSAAVIGAVALSTMTFSATAQEANPAVEARQGYMQVMSLNIGVLGQMARGNTDYDAEAAQIAADNLVTLNQINQSFFWPQGTDTDTIEGTRALPAIWADFAGVTDVSTQYATAVEGLSGVAGDGLDAMRAALGSVGSACGACHDDYRQPR